MTLHFLPRENAPDLPIRPVTVSLGGRACEMWIADDVDVLLNEMIAQPHRPDVRDELLPYWADLWPSAIALAEAVTQSTTHTVGSVIEIGCGPGLPSIAAALRGWPVIFTDVNASALSLAALNARANGIVNPNTRLLDWRFPPEDLRADLILASDVAYEARSFAPLAACFHALLRPGGRVWLTEPQRQIARSFIPALEASGFHAVSRSLSIRYRDQNHDILCWELTRPR